jgi:alkaline phosphatase D
VFLRRRAAAYQAYYEHMPLRRTAAPVGPDMLLYRALNWGQLAQFQFTDTRQYRNRRTCEAHSRGKAIPDCPERDDPARSMLGMPQEAWLMKTWRRRPPSGTCWPSSTRWASSSGRTGTAALVQRRLGRLSGHRQRIIDQWTQAKVSNPVVLGGDIHCFIADELGPDPDHPSPAPSSAARSVRSAHPTRTSGSWPTPIRICVSPRARSAAMAAST